MTIYLGGAMQGLTYKEMNDWREQVSLYFNRCNINIKTINPVDFYNFEIDRNFTDKECMLFDLTAVKKSDLLLVNLNHDSIGTAIEMYEAYKSGIPVVGFNAHDNLHPWMKECCYKICNNLENAIEYIANFYETIL